MSKSIEGRGQLVNQTSLDNELYHYGILGMKWGVRRTPEQLGHKSTSGSKNKSPSKQSISKEEKKKQNQAKKAAKRAKKEAKLREEILRDPKKLYKHRREFSKEEIDAAMKNFEWEKKLNQFSKDDVSISQERMAKYLGMANTALGFYDTTARVVNTFTSYYNGEDSFRLPYLEKADSGKNKKKK